MIRLLARLILLCVALIGSTLLMPRPAQANVVCALNSSGINFGSSSTAIGSVTYTCTNYNTTPAAFTLCVGIGNPSYPGTVAQPQMLNGASTLNFALYTNPAATLRWSTVNPLTTPVSIPAGIGNAVSGSFTFYGGLGTGQTPVPGAYNASFFNTVLGFNTGGSTCTVAANGGDLTAYDFTLSVQANVVNACTVSAGAKLDLGSVIGSATNITGNTSVTVNCPVGTAYYIGLLPSNGNTAGAGIMSGTGTNADHVPYQLRSLTTTGPIWGNTATSTTIGNGVSGIGNGTIRTLTIYAAVSSANFNPDAYSDLITVYVNY